jgi:hypothetical protein
LEPKPVGNSVGSLIPGILAIKELIYGLLFIEDKASLNVGFQLVKEEYFKVNLLKLKDC